MNTNNKGKIRAGIVGVGNWGRYGHLPVLRLLPDFEIVAVASRRPEYATYASDRANGTRLAPTFADAVKMHRLIDLISAASSTGTKQTVNLSA
jgi:predicted dehydrogenase